MKKNINSVQNSSNVIKWNQQLNLIFFKVLSRWGCPINQSGNEDFIKLHSLINLKSLTIEQIKKLYHEYIYSCNFSIQYFAHKNNNLNMKNLKLKRPPIPLKLPIANRILECIKIMKQINHEILPIENLLNYAKLCKKHPTMPSWWIYGEHDLALLRAISLHGFISPQKYLEDKNFPFYHIKLNWKNTISQNGNSSTNLENSFHPLLGALDFQEKFSFISFDKLILRIKYLIAEIPKMKKLFNSQQLDQSLHSQDNSNLHFMNNDFDFAFNSDFDN